MNLDHLLIIDGQGAGPGDLHRGRLLSATSLYEYSIIIWVVSSLYREINHYGSQVTLDAALTQRLNAIQEWIEKGHSLILVGPSSDTISSANSRGAGIRVQANHIFPLNTIRVAKAEGKKLRACGEGTTRSALEPFLQNMSYQATLTGDQLIPLLLAKRATAGEDLVVGGYMPLGKGKIYFIPNCEGKSDTAELFIRELAALPEKVEGKVEDLPQWTERYYSNVEAEVLARIKVLNEKRTAIETSIAAEAKSLDVETRLKHLLSGTGKGFASAVTTALEALGFLVVDGPNSRADLIASASRRYFAIEAKGIEGSVRERQYRQVDRWMAELNAVLSSSAEELGADPELSEYAACVSKVELAEYDGDAKGLLIVGTYRQTSLKERTAPDFPDTVERLLSRTDTCGLTGVQLFGLVMQSRSDPSLKKVIIEELIETRGVLKRCRDWQEFLTGD